MWDCVQVRINHLALRVIRKSSPLTQTALAAKVGMNRANYAHVEAGRRGATEAQIVAIAAALDVPLGAIADGIEDVA